MRSCGAAAAAAARGDLLAASMLRIVCSISLSASIVSGLHNITHWASTFTFFTDRRLLLARESHAAYESHDPEMHKAPETCWI